MKRIFNYQLSRVRRETENAFGVLANRFRVFTTTIYLDRLDPDKATTITFATLVYHNMLCEFSNESYPEGYIDKEARNGSIIEGEWREEETESIFKRMPNCYTRKPSKHREELKNAFVEHFLGPGQIPWQWKMI